jgi:hypothetical protein
MLEQVLEAEIEGILSWIDDQENDGFVQLQSFSWKSYSFHYKGDNGVGIVDHENAPRHEFICANWEEALYTVKDRILNRMLTKS